MERNIVNMHEARRRLTDLDMEPVRDRQCSTTPIDLGRSSPSTVTGSYTVVHSTHPGKCSFIEAL